MSISENNMMLMTAPCDRRSVSPLTPSPSRETRGIRLFRAISRKLTRRSHDDINFDDSRSSSTDSSSSGRCSRAKKFDNSCSSSAESGFRSISPNHISSSSSDAGSDTSTSKSSRRRYTHSTSAESIRKIFQNLTLNTRSKSCTNTKEIKRKPSSKKTPPKRILRTPVAYTYVKGLSGLPTQRVPKTAARLYVSNNCGCSIQCIAALNR